MTEAEMNEFVERVRERSDLYAVASRYLQLTFKGGRYWACCPFHEEKTASFSLSPDKGMFYCFGCHAGGNVFKFLSLIENISYFDAVKMQAERLGIPIPSQEKSPEELQEEQERKTLLTITSLARDYYYSCLTRHEEGEPGRKYLDARGITQSVIRNFKLGYAPDSWDGLTRALRARGFNDKQIVAAGVAKENQSGTGIYDRMRGRVIIPIANAKGEVVAFGGRTLNPVDENNAKYLNTPETEIFSKGRLLFGLDKASGAINAKNSVIVVEGYMDAISLVSAGIDNVVATLGTAFTPEHAKLLRRYARRVIFCYDSDEAGQRATMRALPIINDAVADVLVAVVPDGKDPDEFVQKHGRDAFEQLIKDATPLVDYRIQYVLEHTAHTTREGKIRALDEILAAVIGFDDAVSKSFYCGKISAMLDLDERTIHERWSRLASINNKALDEKIIRVVNNDADLSTSSGKLKALDEILAVATGLGDDKSRDFYCRKISAALGVDEKTVREHWSRIGATKNTADFKNFLRTLDEKIRRIAKNANLSTLAGKTKALDEILATAVDIKSGAIKREFAKKISAALNLDVNQVIERWRSFSARNNAAENQNLAARNTMLSNAGSAIIHMVWYRSDLLDFVLDRTPKETFSKIHQEIISYLKKCQANEQGPNDVSAADELSEAANVELSRILADEVPDASESEMKAFEDSIEIMRSISMKSERDQVFKEAEKYLNSGNEAEYLKKMRQLIRLQEWM